MFFTKMALNRYLLHFSYIGTPFKGAQRQVTGRFPRPDDPSTVQGQLEMALKQLNPTNDPAVFLSSRTDSGVHALNSTCHVDLYRANGLEYEPKTITICLNRFFTKNEVPIRVIKTFWVPPDFHCRHTPISRTYLYRIATAKTEILENATLFNLLPIEEYQRCLFIYCDSFNIDEMRQGAKLFEGMHDFRTFMGRGSHELDKITRRFVNRVEICDGGPSTYSPYSWPPVATGTRENYQFYNIYVEATGFLYRQVRRMVASLVALAQGKITPKEVKLMLEVPSHRSWNDRIKTVPAYGLYLCDVSYDRSVYRGGQ
ncbi:tRNA pseudouridine synthase-like 1 [Tribolium madens]|uniref:tRNA pseudouridine synthase-like 1 n=1 Tax=Tribolium madens TaxID=41895 RepID=UPI001CF7342F|nr:tRNA pseudouridine synthase-like 1 [Tribolium madens]